MAYSSNAPLGDSIEQVYGNHHGWLYGWLWRQLGSREDAAELAQDTFLRLLAARQATVLAEPRAYLRTVAHALVVNHWRRRDLERAYLDALALRPEREEPSPEQRALVLETLVRIDTMLDGLATKVRRAFLMAQLDGMSYLEIGAELGVSDRMVRKYMAQAMLACMCLLDD